MASTPALRPMTVLLLLGALALVAAIAFVAINARGSWDFVLAFRGRKLWGLALIAATIAVSTVLFQTVTGNRILTPAIMGFDYLYQLIQTALVFFLGSFPYATLDPQLRFAGDVLAMTALATLLFRWLFGRTSRSLHLLVLVGIVFGVLFRSLSNLMQRMIDPNAFAVLQDSFFASFSAIEPTLLLVSTILVVALGLVLLLPLLPKLDVLLLGRDTATNLGVDHTKTVSAVLVAIAVFVSISTALVGPVLFFGLLVANLAYLVMPTYRHAYVLPAAALLGFTGLVGGQAVLEHVFGLNTALAIIVEFLGGITFLYLLLRKAPR